MKRPGHVITLIVLFSLSAALHGWLAYGTLRSEIPQVFGLFAALFALYAVLCNLEISARQLQLLLIGAVLLRVIWLFAFPQLSDDWARFVWDGRLIAAGFNPFRHFPSELVRGGFPESRMVDMKLFLAMNSPDYFTIYPPLLQAQFGIASRLAPHAIVANIILLKGFILAAETGSLILLPKLCAAWNISPKKTLLYAFNPLIIAELTGNVHHEAIVIFFLLATLYALQRGHFRLSIFLFAGAVITKLVPLIFLPVLFFHFGLKKGFLFCGGVLLLLALSWIPFVDPSLLRHATASIGLYFRSFEFNGSIYYLVRDIVYHFTHEIRIEIIAPVLGMISTAAILVYAFLQRKKASLQQLPFHFIITLTIYLAFTTMVHPWYISPLIALCMFTPLRFPLVWSAMIVSSYYEYHTREPWVESDMQIWIEYLVVAVAIGFDIYRLRKTALTANNVIPAFSK